MSARPSVVVVAFHRPVEVRSLLRSVPETLDVVVVNVEGDDLVDDAVRAERPAATVVVVPNLGFAGAVNVGVRASRGSPVLICNDDVVLAPHAAERLVAWVADHGGVVGPRVCREDGSEQRTIAPLVSLGSLLWETALLPDAPLPLLDRWLGPAKWLRPSVPTVVPSVSGCTFACDRAVLVDYPLPEEYFMYWEERDWFTRLHHASVEVWYLPDASVVHGGGATEVRPDKQALLASNALRCVRRLHGRPSAVAAVPIVLLWQLRLLGQDLVASLWSPTPRRRLGARVAGVRAALSGMSIAVGR